MTSGGTWTAGGGGGGGAEGGALFEELFPMFDDVIERLN